MHSVLQTFHIHNVCSQTLANVGPRKKFVHAKKIFFLELLLRSPTTV